MITGAEVDVMMAEAGVDLAAVDEDCIDSYVKCSPRNTLPLAHELAAGRCSCWCLLMAARLATGFSAGRLRKLFWATAVDHP